MNFIIYLKDEDFTMLRFVIYVLGLSSAWAQNFDPDLDVADYKDMYGNHDPGIAEENIGGEYMGGDEYYYGGGYGMEDYGKEFGAGDNKGKTICCRNFRNDVVYDAAQYELVTQVACVKQ